MTSTVAFGGRLAWEDRWSQPTIDQLIEPLEAQHRKVIEGLFERVAAYDHVGKSLVWYGAGWHWTVQYDLRDPDGNFLETLFYVMLGPEAPMVCVPLSDATFEMLPLRRLHRYVRNEVRVAKRAVSIHWANFTLSATSELDHLMDLIKRKYRLACEPFKAAKSAK